jgi:hypothetical protein
MYITTRGEGVYRSDDGGMRWQNANMGLPKGIGAPPTAPIDSAVIHPTDANVVYVALEAKGVYKSIDGATTWERSNEGLPEPIFNRTQPWVLTIDQERPERLLFWASWPVNSSVIDSAFFISTNAGINWYRLNQFQGPARVFDVQFAPTRGTLALATSEKGVVGIPDLIQE